VKIAIELLLERRWCALSLETEALPAEAPTGRLRWRVRQDLNSPPAKVPALAGLVNGGFRASAYEDAGANFDN
jgi:hypothetical protein